jgi:light-regulated signal transduction histidine kinase (bacteriophytochrome)
VLDISERKRAEAERDRLIAALERSNRELDQFAYVASHDLKAPLRGIANLAQWIEDDLKGIMPDDTREQMRLLTGRVHRMEALINGILAYSRAGRVHEQPERVDVGALLSESIELLSPTPPASIQAEGPMPTVHSERVPLQQVFLNLMSNSLKHALRPDASVRVRASEAGDFWEFSVADNGPGIPPEYHERIWGIFQTLRARDEVEGTGIGLSVVKKIVEARGGQVRVESAPGQGAIFFFTWPKSISKK